jgi:hypothetical protein
MTILIRDAEGRASLRDQVRSTLIRRPHFSGAPSNGEVWAAIPGFVGYYRVSNIGRVLRLPRTDTPDVRLWRPLLIEPSFSGGYFRVFLRDRNDLRRQYRIDRLMLSAFSGRPLTVHDVAYINGDRCDLRLENLKRLNTITVLGPPRSRRKVIIS